METANTPALLLLDLPASALAGIDLLAFTVTPRFHGVKDLTPGFHFTFTGTSTAFSSRHGLWFRVFNTEGSAVSSLFITKWNTTTETLEVETNDAERLRNRANLGKIWREGLTPYRQTTTGKLIAAADNEDEDAQNDEEEINDWPSLTSAINEALLSRITGGDSNHWHLTSASSARQDLEDIPGLTEHDKDDQQQTDGELHLLPIDLKQTWRDGATGRERTEAAQDRSWALENLLQHHCSTTSSSSAVGEVLGELQFCFLMVLTLNNFSCLEQWKRILSLLLTCKSAISQRPAFFVRVLAALRLQLQHCRDAEGGLIDLADEGGSLLKSLLVRFRKGLEALSSTTTAADSMGGVADVLDELDDLEEYLGREHQWQFGGSFARSGLLELEDGERVEMESSAFDEDDETGEFAPLIVELTPAQARLLNVTPEDASALGHRLGRASLRDGVEGVVQDSGEESEGERERDESEDEEEEMQDLEDMDSRF